MAAWKILGLAGLVCRSGQVANRLDSFDDVELVVRDTGLLEHHRVRCFRTNKTGYRFRCVYVRSIPIEQLGIYKVAIRSRYEHVIRMIQGPRLTYGRLGCVR